MSVDNITELRKRIPGGKYALTRAVAERAKQLQNGALPLVEVKIANPITVAIDEVLQDKVTFEFKSQAQVEAEKAAQESSDAEVKAENNSDAETQAA
jgi:DNA-directed RNA polymerase subunit K/omega